MARPVDQLKYTSVIYDFGYAILGNGDIVTSDGKPRTISEVDLILAQNIAGGEMEFRFRKPTPEEVADLREQGIIL